MKKRTNELPVEHTILVATGDQALPTGDLTTTGTAMNLASGQIGVVSYDPNSAVKATGKYLASGDDSNEVQAIKLVQGTPKSNKTQTVSGWDEGDSAYEQSGVIRKNHVQNVSVKKASFGQWGGVCISAVPTPNDTNEYSLTVYTDSPRIDRINPMNDRLVQASLPVTDFTTLGIAQPKDYVLQKLASQLNSQSRMIARSGTGLTGNKDYVVLGVKIGAGSGQVINTVTPTTNITVEVRNGVNQVIQLGEAGVTALARLVHLDANLAGTSTIEVINTLTAGTAATIDALLILGVPHELAAAYDDVNETQVSIDVSLSDSLKPYTTTRVAAINAENTGRMWLNEWRQRPALFKHTKQTMPMGDYFLEGKTYINEAKMYTSYLIDFYDTEETLTTQESGQKQVIILLPCEKSSAFTVTVANVVTRIAAGSTPITMVTSNDAGTGTASVNTVSGLEAVLSAWLEHSRTTGVNFKVTGDAVAGGTYLS